MSGAIGNRCADVTARQRTWLPATAGSKEPVVLNMASSRPEMRSVMAPPVTPRYGTWVISTPAMCLNNSPARYGIEPMPGDAQLILPGLALAKAMKSASLANDEEFGTTMRLG